MSPPRLSSFHLQQQQKNKYPIPVVVQWTIIQRIYYIQSDHNHHRHHHPIFLAQEYDNNSTGAERH